MSFVRRVLVVGVTAASVLGSPAMAAPAPRCLLVIDDPAGDATSQVPVRAARSDLDIRAVSVATDTSGLRLTMRVARLGAPEPSGAVYETGFSVKGVTYWATAMRDLDGTTFHLKSSTLQVSALGITQTRSTPVDGIVDQGTSSVSILVPFALIGTPGDGVSLRGISGTSFETFGSVGVGTSDETDRGRDFALNRSACRTS